MTTNEQEGMGGYEPQVDPFSEELEMEALRRGSELERSAWKAPVALVRKQWERFQHAQHKRTITAGRWKAAKDSVEIMTNLRFGQLVEFGPAVARIYGELEQRFPPGQAPGFLVSISAQALEPLSTNERLGQVLDVAKALQNGSPELRELAHQLVSEAHSLAILHGEWERRGEKFRALHAQLKLDRIEWGLAWHELEKEAQDREETVGLHTKLFLRSQIELNRIGIPALVPVLGLADQIRGLLKWAKAKLAAKPVVVRVVMAMAGTTVTVGTVAGFYAWHRHGVAVVVSGAGVNRH